MSPVFDCTTPEGRIEAVLKAAEGIKSGQLAVLPTDTVYGVGADAFAPLAVTQLLAAKGRGREVPPPVLIADLRAVDGLAIDVPDYARALMEEFWPGPLTLVLRAQPSLAWDLGETNGTVALRMPNDEIALALLREVGPMAVTSANRHGYPASRTVLDAATQLGGAVEFYLDGGPARGGIASTILDCTREEPIFLRRGALTEEQLGEVLARFSPPAEEDEAPATDGPTDPNGHDALEWTGPQVSETDAPDGAAPTDPADPQPSATESNPLNPQENKPNE